MTAATSFILLTYDLKAAGYLDHDSETKCLSNFHETELNGFNDLNMQEKIIRRVFRRFYFKDMVLEFSNGGQTCLTARLSNETYRKDMNYLNTISHAELELRLYVPMVDRIKTELMAYERQEFTHREIIL